MHEISFAQYFLGFFYETTKQQTQSQQQPQQQQPAPAQATTTSFKRTERGSLLFLLSFLGCFRRSLGSCAELTFVWQATEATREQTAAAAAAATTTGASSSSSNNQQQQQQQHRSYLFFRSSVVSRGR
jgi:hypothetical protein